MNTVIFTLVAILLILFIVIQIFRLNAYVIALKKDEALLQQHVAEEEQYQFIKGLY
ncbi:hypothetical protein [Hydrotalea sp.]|uniref:hypothetical protein n=1 Tax=Hydrotalea sp. TaxID=2881279 RepID=UPI003D095A21